MSKITQYSRISHHTIAGSMSATFSVPTSEDFTDGSWTSRDLALSEIGVNEDSKKAYIRINDEVKEIQLAGGTSSAEPLSTTLVAGNTTGANWINVDSGYGLTSSGGSVTDTISLDTINGTDIKSKNTTTGNISSSTYTPDTIISTATDVASTITDTITLDPQGLVGGTGIRSTNNTTGFGTGIGVYTDQTIISAVATDATSDITISGANIISTATDVANTITDSISLDPQVLGNGTGISSTNTTTGDISSTTYTPNGIDTSVINPGTNQLTFGMNITPTPVISLVNDNAFLGDISSLNLGYSLSTLKSDNTTTGITDTLSIDPEGLGNGTGIKSIDTTTTDNNYIKVTPTQINIFQDDVTNGQIRYITLGSNAISLVAGSNAIVIDESSQAISLSTDKISIGSSNVKNIISTGTTTTTNATITTIHTFTCVSSGPKSYKVRVIGNKTDYSKSYLGELFGLYNYDGATVTLIGSLDLIEKTNFTTATSTISISGTTILVRVTGEALTDINWSVYVEMNDIQ